jgi:hypothetical protein
MTSKCCRTHIREEKENVEIKQKTYRKKKNTKTATRSKMKNRRNIGE